jgi:hypothetical protein
MASQHERPMEAQSIYMDRKEGIKNLHSLFGPHSLDSSENKGLSTVLEISLYALFASFIAIMLLLPNHADAIQSMFPNTPLTDPIGFVLWIKMTLFISALVPLFWALHLSSKRLKGRLNYRRYI